MEEDYTHVLNEIEKAEQHFDYFNLLKSNPAVRNQAMVCMHNLDLMVASIIESNEKEIIARYETIRKKYQYHGLDGSKLFIEI